MDTSARLLYLFEKYLQRTASVQEREELFYLMGEPGAEEAIGPQLQLLWEEIKNDKIAYNVDWEKMYASVVSSGKEADQIINRATAVRRKRMHYTGLLLTVLLVVAGIAGYRMLKDKPLPEESAALAPATGKRPVRETQTIHLPDGSTVILNNGSKLNYPSAFNGAKREVYLSGEGFFDITHNPAKPFVVHAGKLAVRVLGTAFNIRAWGSEEKTEVTVTRGKVQVIKEDKILGTLTASQQLSLTNDAAAPITRFIDTLPVIAWKPAEIVFNNISMEEAAAKLQQRFAVNIEFKNPEVRLCRVSATFSEEDMPEEILTVLCAVIGASYTMPDGKFMIEGKVVPNE